MASLVDLELQRQRLLAERDTLSAAALAGDQTALARIANINAQLRMVTESIDALSRSTASSGNLVRDDQLATAPKASTQAPNSPQQVLQPDGRIATVPDTTSGTTATPPVDTTAGTANVDRGLAAPVRPLAQTQATGPYTQGINIRAEDGTLSTLRRNPETGELYDPGGIPGC